MPAPANRTWWEQRSVNQQTPPLFVHGKQYSFPDRSKLRCDRRQFKRSPPPRFSNNINLLQQQQQSSVSAAKYISPNPSTQPMTGPLSLNPPTEFDNRLTSDLEAELAVLDPLASPEDVEARKELLKKVKGLLEKWAAAQSERMGWSSEDAARVEVDLRPFGSYCLGAYGSKADMDMVAIFPGHIDRTHFFKFFPATLRECPEVTELTVIAEAFVPLIKMTIRGIDVDLLFASLLTKLIQGSVNLSDDTILLNLPEVCVRSLNGCRVSDAIIRTIPNMDEFRTALRAIKVWAKRHGVYGNTLGYLGGISWAILMARICQLYPKANAAILVKKFFLIWSLWDWPRPVLLNQIQNVMSLNVWDPRVNELDRLHLLPIITPVYPASNTTYNVSAATFSVIVSAFKRGLEMVAAIDKGNATWSDLFTPFPFFANFKHFVALETSAASSADLAQWSGMIESRTRHLVRALLDNESLDSLTIWPNAVEKDLSKTWWIGFSVKRPTPGESVNINLQAEFGKFVTKVYESGRSFWREGMNLETKYVRGRELKSHVPASLLRICKKKKARVDSESSGEPARKRLKGNVTPGSTTSTSSSGTVRDR